MTATRPTEAAIAAAAARVTAYAEAMSGQTPVPGGSWAVVDRDGVIASDCWGLADLAAGAHVEPGHRFEIGSISKVVTAIVIHRGARRPRPAGDRRPAVGRPRHAARGDHAAEPAVAHRGADVRVHVQPPGRCDVPR